MDFLDDKRGFAGTIDGVLFSTTDGGDHWVDVSAALPRRAKGFCGITHTGDRVHLVGKYFGGAADHFVSQDAGKTWRADDLSQMAYGLVDIVFLNSSVGLIGGMSNRGEPGSGPAVILKTDNAGSTWRTVFTDEGGRGFAWKLFPVDDQLVYAALQSQDGTYRAAKSTDGGATWTISTIATGQPPGPGIQAVGFVDGARGWAGGFFQGLYTTFNGGHSWEFVPMSGRSINRFERVGKRLVTASSRGVLQYESGSLAKSATETPIR